MDERATLFNMLPIEMLEKIFIYCDMSSIENIRKLKIVRVNCVLDKNNKPFWKNKYQFEYHNYTHNKYFKPVLYVMENIYDSYNYMFKKVPPYLKAEEYFIIHTLNKILKPEIASDSCSSSLHPNVVPAVLPLISTHQPSTLACDLVRSIISSGIDIKKNSVSPRLIDYLYTECFQPKDHKCPNTWIVLPKTHSYIYKSKLLQFTYKLDKNLHTDAFKNAVIEWEQMTIK